MSATYPIYTLFQRGLKLSNCQQHTGLEEYILPSHFQPTVPDDPPRHFCLSKAPLIGGFEMTISRGKNGVWAVHFFPWVDSSSWVPRM